MTVVATPAQVRRATSADMPRIVAIRAAVRENILSDPSRVTEAAIRWFIEHGPIWVWSENGEVCGFSAGDPRDGTIWALFVDPTWEGRGIGRALIDLACRSLRDSGHQVVTLGAQPGTRAEKFVGRTDGWPWVAKRMMKSPFGKSWHEASPRH